TWLADLIGERQVMVENHGRKCRRGRQPLPPARCSTCCGAAVAGQRGGGGVVGSGRLATWSSTGSPLSAFRDRALALVSSGDRSSWRGGRSYTGLLLSLSSRISGSRYGLGLPPSAWSFTTSLSSW